MIGVGSMRSLIEDEGLFPTFDVRSKAPTIPIYANLGAVQLNYGYGLKECQKAVDLLAANGLILHLNSIQEVIQPEGDTNFKGLLTKIESICKYLEVPVGIKEVGWGISAEVARMLHEVGADFIDVAGAGGTSWSQVEKYRANDPFLYELGDAFKDWGIPTTECIINVRNELPNISLIGSGGIKNGVDAAKALSLGADIVGFGRSLLRDATSSAERVCQTLDLIEQQLKLAMFGIGAKSISELKSTPRIHKAY